jgi:5,10-methylene-tetrahydrofolate dehydrogenase/methenyl tetrahydrofolate cyclohydrolase
MTVARLAQSVERKALNLVVVGSSPTVGKFVFLFLSCSLRDVYLL